MFDRNWGPLVLIFGGIFIGCGSVSETDLDTRVDGFTDSDEVSGETVEADAPDPRVSDVVESDGSTEPDTRDDRDAHQDGVTGNRDGSEDTTIERVCNTQFVDDCECDPAAPDSGQCCWRGTAYACTATWARAPGRPPSQFQFEYEPTVPVDNCESLPVCPLEELE